MWYFGRPPNQIKPNLTIRTTSTKKKQNTKISNSFMTEIIFIVVKPKKTKTHAKWPNQSALIWRNALEMKKQMGLFSWYVKTDPVVHRQIRKLFSKMFMYLLKTAKDFIYIRKKNTTNISTHHLKRKKTRHQKCDQNDKSERKTLI